MVPADTAASVDDRRRRGLGERDPVITNLTASHMPFVLSRGPPLPRFPALLVIHSSKIVGRFLTLEVVKQKSTYKKRGGTGRLPVCGILAA